jgi:hypothetical protein
MEVDMQFGGLGDLALHAAPGGEWLHMELLAAADKGCGPIQADVFLGGLDQRAADAGGAGACACLAVELAAWLETHPGELPTADAGAQLDDLIRTGSAQWRALVSQASTAAAFPDGHLDVDTALAAHQSEAGKGKLRPVPGASYVGFLPAPPNTPAAAALAGAPRLRDALSSAATECGAKETPATAVLSLLDHHCCVRLSPAGECVLLDTLGERLFEANGRAFVARFACIDDLCAFVERVVAGPRLSAEEPSRIGADKLQCDVHVVRV